MAYYLLFTTYSIDSAFTTDGDWLPTPVSIVTATESSATKSETIQPMRQSDYPYWLDLAPTCSLEGRRRTEMEARDRRYELEYEARYEIEGDCGSAEMTGSNGGVGILSSL